MIRTASVLLAACACLAGAADLKWVDQGAGRIALMEDGQVALAYNYGPQLPAGVPQDRRRCCYIHPVNTPAGVTVTDDFPKDHYHHRGIFWAWNVVEVDGAKYDLWTLKGAAHEFVKWGKRSGPSIEAYNRWLVAGARPVVNERVSIRAFPREGAAREFEVTLELEAIGAPVTLRGAQDMNKGYGGFSARFAPRERTSLRAAEGAVPKDEDHHPHSWVEFTAVYQGKPAGLRITPDPRNPATPNEWCLRYYGFAGANYPGTSAVTLEKGKPLTLRYRVRVFDQ